MTNTLPTWDLTNLYAGVDDPQIASDIHSVTERAAQFARDYRGSIATQDLTAIHLLKALKKYEQLLGDEYRPQAYASLLYSTDTSDTARGALLQKSREFGSAVSTHLVFFDLEIGQIPDVVWAAICDDPRLAPYRH
ncbi:MAG: oligoendopeptidase, partial [Gemmatimonadaceae bacterium]|nr:oligoendopeptidase [Gemmatimonadaceae bacterium]